MNIETLSIVMGVDHPVEISPELRNFLAHDDQGMDGLEFMLNDENLCKRIPQNVRVSYETLYFLISSELDENWNKIEASIKEARSNPKPLIHNIIQKSYECGK